MEVRSSNQTLRSSQGLSGICSLSKSSLLIVVVRWFHFFQVLLQWGMWFLTDMHWWVLPFTLVCQSFNGPPSWVGHDILKNYLQPVHERRIWPVGSPNVEAPQDSFVWRVSASVGVSYISRGIFGPCLAPLCGWWVLNIPHYLCRRLLRVRITFCMAGQLVWLIIVWLLVLTANDFQLLLCYWFPATSVILICVFFPQGLWGEIMTSSQHQCGVSGRVALVLQVECIIASKRVPS